MLVYYRIYAEDGAIASKTPVTPCDPFLGRIKAISVPPPHTVTAVKRSIAKVENIKNRTNTSLFLTPYSQSPMGDAENVAIFNCTGPGSKPQEPLALVAKMSDSDRSALESERRSELASAAEPEETVTPPEIRYRTFTQHSPAFLFVLISRLLGKVYYLLYADDYEIPSKVSIYPEMTSLGRIRVDFVAPPHSPASIKRCISRVERTPELAHADIFADISCVTPLKEGHISILCTNGPGLSPNKPIAIVQMPIVQVETPSIPDGRYVIKNRAADIYWYWSLRSKMVYFWSTGTTLLTVKGYRDTQVSKHSPIIQV